MLKEEFPPTEEWFTDHEVRVDLGFQALIVVSATKTHQTEKCETEKWRFLFFCLTFFCLMAETMIKTGFQGIEKDYVGQAISIPDKKPKQQELTPEQKAENKLRASQRVPVEHSIAGLKRYRILSDRLRMHDLDLYHDVLGVCAGLWNFCLTCWARRHNNSFVLSYLSLLFPVFPVFPVVFPFNSGLGLS